MNNSVQFDNGVVQIVLGGKSFTISDSDTIRQLIRKFRNLAVKSSEVGRYQGIIDRMETALRELIQHKELEHLARKFT